MSDHKLAKWMLLILLIPIIMATCSGDRFRYPCQDPKNWEKEMCKPPTCEVTRTCPEQIFKGNRDGKSIVPQQPDPTPVKPGVVCK